MCFCCIAYCTVLSRQTILQSAFSVVLLTHNMRQIDLYANCTPYLTLCTCHSFRLCRRIENKLTERERKKTNKKFRSKTFQKTIQSFLLFSPNKWIFSFFLFYFLVSAVSIELCSNCFIVSIINRPYDSNGRAACMKRKNNSTLLQYGRSPSRLLQ